MSAGTDAIDAVEDQICAAAAGLDDHQRLLLFVSTLGKWIDGSGMEYRQRAQRYAEATRLLAVMLCETGTFGPLPGDAK